MNIVCNICGKTIQVENGIPREDFIEIKKSWGYFSDKDGSRWSFNICESCADRLAEQCTVPVDITDNTELL
jgi:ribosomal-protein-alanine N-acetyltransferase